MYQDLPWLVKDLTQNKSMNAYQKSVAQIYQSIKFHNPQSLLGITQQDIHDLTASLESNYSPMIVEQAKNEMIKSCSGKSFNLGVFLEKCQGAHRAQQNFDNTQKLIASSEMTEDKKALGKKHLAQIREMLKPAIKPLPYDKNFRVNANAQEGDGELLSSPKSDARAENLARFEKAKQANFAVDPDTIEDKELRTLYVKAWSDGLDLNEKQRFSELAGQQC
jgi:hypothetical protein